MKNTTINFHSVKIAQTLPEKLLGLLNPKTSRQLLIKTRFGIHTFFLKEPIDVVVLNNKNQVIKYKQNFKPNKIFFWNPKYSQALELPSGSIKKLKLKKGDQIELS